MHTVIFIAVVESFPNFSIGNNFEFAFSLTVNKSSSTLGWCSLSMSGAQPGLVPSDACHVAGEQWFRGGAEWNQEPAREAGVHHEAGDKPVCAADWAQRTGISCDSQLTPSFCNTPSSFSVCVFLDSTLTATNIKLQFLHFVLFTSSFLTCLCLHTIEKSGGKRYVSHMLASLQSCENRKLSQDSVLWKSK